MGLNEGLYSSLSFFKPIMTFKTKFYTTDEWDMKVILISLYHNQNKLKDKKWTIKQTSIYFGVSKSYISEALLISDNIDKVLECKSRNEALKRIRSSY